MKKKYFYVLSAISMILAYINPIHFSPFPAIHSIFLAIFSILFLIPLINKSTIEVPKFSLVLLGISLIVWIQYFYGLVFYLNTAIMVSGLIIIFFLTLILSFNIQKINPTQLMLMFCYIFCISSFFSSVIAILQWLQVENTFFISPLNGSRPYANINQVNRLATLLILGLFANLYFYEKKIINKMVLVLLTILFIFALALTQSRTVWVISIISFLYFSIFREKLNLNLKKKFLFLLSLIFLNFVLFLPLINSQLSCYFNVLSTSTLIDRVTSGYLRINIWNQMLYALYQKPFSGYGWFQTSFAQFSIIDKVHGTEWASSAHNFFLDLLVWNGLIIGSLIILYIIKFFLAPLFTVNTKETFIAALMVLAIGTHSMLEFPIFYTYFNLPFAVLLGVIWSEKKTISIKLKYFFIKILAFLILLTSITVFNQYTKINMNIIAARLYEGNSINYKLYNNTPLFDDYEAKARWYALDPYSKLEEKDIKYYHDVVVLNLTPYDLGKYSIILYNSNNINEARRVIKINKIMYHSNLDEKFVKQLILENKQK